MEPRGTWPAGVKGERMRDIRQAIIIGGGPGGLYAAILLRLVMPTVQVTIFERQSAEHETFGFGVAFHEATLRKLAEADPVSRAGLEELLRPWDDVAFHVRGHEYRVAGHAFAGCSRDSLIRLLRGRATELGARIEFVRSASATEHAGADLVIIADGSGSRNRALLAPDATVSARPNWFVWLGTTRPMAEMNFFFRETPYGLFVAHAYPHDAGTGTWIVETESATLRASGLEGASQAVTAEAMQRVFADDLAGAALLARDSSWRQFPVVRCARWADGNMALIGDAKATVHYSIGSGTKIAMEDAVALVAAVASASTVTEGLARYEQDRRPQVEQLQARAYGSMLWFETMDAHWDMPAAQFAFSGVTRKTDETYASVRSRGDALATAALHAFAGAGDADPLDVPVRISSLQLPGRRLRTEDTAPPDPARPAALALSTPVTSAQEAYAAVDRLAESRAAARGIVVSATGQLPSAVEAAARSAELLVIDVDDLAAATGLVSAARAAWPRERPLGIRIRPCADPQAILPMLGAAIAEGCDLVVVSPEETAGEAAASLVVPTSDFIRHALKTPTACAGPRSREAAETILISGRADLVEVS
jgi:2-polyprenyl-6-methoxyphenol hydroxylase-like FAD-dependent oxidoreductase